MKIPELPPTMEAYISSAVAAADGKPPPLASFMPWIGMGLKPFDARGRYLHWDELKYKEPPGTLTPEEYWLATKQARMSNAETLPLTDKDGINFHYCPNAIITADLLTISEQAKGAVAADPQVKDPSTQRTYLINSLIEEAISSSQLEGASTTTRVAKEMIRTERAPNTHSEQMILNNYRAMLFIKQHVDDNLTPAIIFELHRLLMEGTVEKENLHKVGQFRTASDDIAVVDNMTGVSLHIPPTAGELRGRLKALCDFANGKTGDQRLPDVIRAILVHFMVGYDHPFFDGNGRVARALFFWMVVRSGFWLLEYTSISSVIKKAEPSYVRAYMHSETDGGDVTYFIVHQLDVIKKSIARLHSYLARKTREQHRVRDALAKSGIAGMLNHRQLALLHNAIEKPGAQYTVKSHQTSHGVAYETARSDLLAMSESYGLLQQSRKGKVRLFLSPADIGERIKVL